MPGVQRSCQRGLRPAEWPDNTHASCRPQVSGGRRGQVRPMTTITARPRRWQWPAETTTPRKARRATRRLLAKWQLDGLADDAVLLVSELVANACLYGGSPITLTLRPTAHGIRAEIGDPDPVMPLIIPPPERGLGIVLALARAVWVTRRRDGGKLVCFMLEDT